MLGARQERMFALSTFDVLFWEQVKEREEESRYYFNSVFNIIHINTYIECVD